VSESRTDLVERYGKQPSQWRPIGIGLVAAVAVGFGAWVTWAAVVHGSPAVDGDLILFDITNSHEVSATVDIRLKEDTEATCRLRALAEDKYPVGELAFDPHNGRNKVVVRTEREASSLELLGCSVKD
jgi:hypothetical protein